MSTSKYINITCTTEEFETAVDAMLQFVDLRSRSIIGQLGGDGQGGPGGNDSEYHGHSHSGNSSGDDSKSSD